MSDQIFQLLLTYGPAVLVPWVAVAAVGIPLPTTILLLGAGAFASAGEVSLVALIVSALLGAILGDSTGYWIGRRGGAAALQRWGGRLKLKTNTVASVEERFVRWASPTIVLTRFLLTPLGPVVNIVAGTSKYAFRRFFLWDFVGELIWVLLYVGLGFAFGASWDLLASLLGSATSLLSLLAVTGLIALLAYRAIVRDWLRARKDAPADLPLH